MKREIVTPRQLIKTSNNWIKGASARNQEGDPVSPSNPDAVSFCLMGALDRVYYENKLDSSATLQDALHELMWTRLREIIETGDHDLDHDLDHACGGLGLVTLNDQYAYWPDIDKLLNETDDQVKKILMEANGNGDTTKID